MGSVLFLSALSEGGNYHLNCSPMEQLSLVRKLERGKKFARMYRCCECLAAGLFVLISYPNLIHFIIECKTFPRRVCLRAICPQLSQVKYCIVVMCIV